ncbi:restriction endonuclease subunit S [Caldibacillus thermoamylovorans]|uniref:Type I restriction-modification system, specificity subunit S n=1 Tax=Caldibacillus thermoamylovorans TaxID=35841 RepID=A0ABD4A2A2_9BACI|nr:restriction endonuclease subunit S [Caldibacillus thermoamylovorans]KIO60700.1 Type I restriction-modification system, specificity subunit S [Caldibacillus thermoamylovorans]KIO70604.1 Type I restriction-modification system, specificity subunit S [Caldibacillus thermoamylovorans]
MESNEWKEYRFSELVEIIGGGTPKTNVEKYWNGDIPWLSVKDFNSDNRKIYYTEKTITKEGLKNSSTNLLEEGDLIISARGTVGALAQLGRPMAFNQSCYGLKAKKITSNDFIYYLLKYKIREIKQNIHGSVFDTITRNTFDVLTAKIPNIKEQKAIANILSTLDEKIETNNKINKKLEEMAQALFKHWFVDFEFPNENGKPYKSSGGEMVESELGEIPKGWKVDKLSSIAEIIMGQSPKSDTYNTDKIGLPLLNGATDFQNKNLSPSKYTSDPKKVGEKGDFVFGVRATIGLVTELDDRYAIGRGSGIARAFDNMYKEFLYEILNIAFSNFQYTASGSVYLNVSKNDLEDYKLVIPDINILRRYHKITKSILNQKENLKRENAVLEKLRDTLLPKLMSGEIRVPLDDEVLSEKN